MSANARPPVRDTARPAWRDLFPAFDYWTDACQRTVLVLDILRERGNTYRDHNAGAAPNVLDFDVELIRDGRTLPRRVNYLLAQHTEQPVEKIQTDFQGETYFTAEEAIQYGFIDEIITRNPEL